MAEREVKIVITGEDRSKAALASATKGWTKLNKTILGTVGTALKSLAKLGIAATVAFAAFAALSVKTAIEVESAFAGVVKTTDGLVDEFGDLNAAGVALKEEFRALALQVPTDLPELLRLGEVGGQLGIASENLLGFTETMTAMGVATDLTGEQAAVAFARIANVMQTSQEDFDRMGSSVVALGNTFATNEPAIVDFAQRIAAAGEIAGLTEADVFGMAAAFSAVGVNAEAGGTAVQKVLIAMTQSVAEGGDQLDIFAETAGISADEFARAFRNDAAVAFRLFTEGLNRQGDSAFRTLEDLELQDQRLIRAFLSLAGAGKLLGETIDVSNKAWDANTALAKEAEQRYHTLESQFGLVKNIVKDVGLSFGEVLTPFIRESLEAALPFIQEFARNLPALLEERVVPAIGKVAAWLKDQAVPAFASLVTFLKTQVVPSFSILIGWLKENVIPAFSAVATFLKEKGIPAFGDMITFLRGLFVPALSILTGSLTGNVIPAFLAVATFVTEKAIPAFGTFVAFLNEHVFPILAIVVDWVKIKLIVAFSALTVFLRDKVAPAMGVLVTTFANIIRALGDFVRDLQAGREPIEAWSRLLENFVPDSTREAIIRITVKVREFVKEVIEFVRVHGPALRAAFVAIGAVILSASVIGAIAGFIAAINPISLTIFAIGAAAGLLAAAWTENWGGIRDTATAVWAALKPIFETLTRWMADTIPVAVAVLAKIWEETLMPAFTRVWEFIRDSIIPLWISLANLGIAIVKKEVELFIAVWEKLKPLFNAIWIFIKNNIIPVFQTFGGVLTSIKTQIASVIKFINDLIDKIGDIKLPDFLTSTAGLSAMADLIRDMPEVVLEPIRRDMSTPFIDPIRRILESPSIDPIRRDPGLILGPIRREMLASTTDPVRRDGPRIHIENLNVSGSGSAAADVRNVVTMLEFGTRTV